MSHQVPIVDYLALDDKPRLIAQECDNCGARYFERRNACASCFTTSFSPAEVPTTGTLKTFTIVSMSAPGIPVPFVAGVVDCAGTAVRANIVNTEPTADAIRLGMPLRLVTYSVGTDDDGIEAIGFGFEPSETPSVNGAI
ncbi:Zn-ribbon domain-containing OB-fold protein [Nocardia arizonensis]|uniref:Zn-ribbon domain-containing OB-fold protein n=1 Tax=Nocardia arizonensis TaxID=1141647 RepID=UPI0006D274CE|nr:OB-fold domain-containing protein [Nocardia arizonensis]